MLRFLRPMMFLIAALTPFPANGAETADRIYHGGDIVTVDDKHPTAEALAVKNGKILAVGTKPAVLKYQGNATKLIDLKGKTLVPGFLDGHSHFINSLQVARQANCFAPPAGPANPSPTSSKRCKISKRSIVFPRANSSSATATTEMPSLINAS